MNSGEYREQLMRLKARYGEKAYDEEFGKILWRDAQKYPDGGFTRTVDAILSEHFRPIGKTAILEILKQESARLTGSSPNVSRIIPRDCASCMGDGLLVLFDEQGSKFFFSCDKCRNGAIQREVSGRVAPHIDDGLRRGYRRSQVKQ